MNRKGTLIVLDGTDGTGKNTQSKLIFEKLPSITDKKVEMVSFPNYGKASSTMVTKYLNGEFGPSSDSLDLYTNSTFYSIDRSISYKTEDWGRVYDDNNIIIADRYTTANTIHQGGNIIKNYGCLEVARSKFIGYLKWLYDLEYKYMKIPMPNLIIILRASEAANNKLIEKRKVENPNHNNDIHERDLLHLECARKCIDLYEDIVKNPFEELYEYCYLINHVFINIDDGFGNVRPIEDINNEIMTHVKKYI